MSEQCPNCDSIIWYVTDTHSGRVTELSAETRECECGHEWTEVLTA